MTEVNRFQDLQDALPAGKTYETDGVVYPYQDAPIEIQIQTQKTSTVFEVEYGTYQGLEATSDADGLVLVRTRAKLSPGEYELVLTSKDLDRTRISYFFTVTDIATFHAAIADVLETMDAEIDKITAALSLNTVGTEYIQDAFGRSVRQPRPSWGRQGNIQAGSFSHEDYRNLLLALRPAYRHFGAHPRGRAQALEAFLSSSPFTVPHAWRPTWALGSQVMENADLKTRTKLCSQMFAPAGAVDDQDLPDINRQSRVYVHPAIPASGSVTGASNFHQPPVAQQLSVTLYGTPTDSVILEGTDVLGNEITETVPAADVTLAAITYRTQNTFATITSAENPNSDEDCEIGLADSRFITIDALGPYNQTDETVPLYYVNMSAAGEDATLVPKLRYGSTNADALLVYPGIDGTTLNAVGLPTITLHDVGRYARAIGTKETSTSYNLDPTSSSNTILYHDRLYLSVDDLGIVTVPISAATVTPDNLVTAINDAFAADSRYDALSAIPWAPAYKITGDQGDNQSVVVLAAARRFSSKTETPSKVTIHPGPADASPFVLGLPLAQTRVATTPGSTSLVCLDTSAFPVPDADRPNSQYKIRIRGLRKTSSTITALTESIDGTTAEITVSGYSFTTADIQGYVRITDTTEVGNSGMHRIIEVDSGVATVLHEGVASGDTFTTNSTGVTCSIWHRGQIHTVTANNTGTNTLTLDATPLAWPVNAIVELVDATPYSVEGTDGLGTVTVTVDERYRPLHDFGGTIAHVSGSTWRLTSTRGNFSAASTGTANLTISDCTNSANNGTFNITAVDGGGAHIDFTNGSAVAETSNFEWAVNPTNAISDNIEIVGSLLPDGWELVTTDTIAIESNTSPDGLDTAPGLLVASPIVFQDTTGNITIQKRCPEALDYLGLPLTFTAWLSEHTGSADYVISVFFDLDMMTEFEVESATISSTMLNALGSTPQFIGPQRPVSVSGTFYVPYNAETVIIHLSRVVSPDAAGTFSLEKTSLVSATGTGYFFGSNTMCRSPKRSKFGEVLYVWCPEYLSNEEKIHLGLPLDEDEDGVEDAYIANKPGHIDYLVNSHGYWNRSNISELNVGVDETTDPPQRQNLIGVYNDEDWTAVDNEEGEAELVQLVREDGTPPRLSRVVPARLTSVAQEELTLTGGGLNEATLEFISNHTGPYPQAPNTGTGSGARLYELRATDTRIESTDEYNFVNITIIPAGTPIPLPDTADADDVLPWVFSAADEIEINSAYLNSTSTYVLDYDLLMQATTGILTLPSTRNDYLWLVDLAAYRRTEVEPFFTERVEQLLFKNDYSATLKNIASTTDDATLIADNGVTRTEVSRALWSFIDNKNIRLDPKSFSANSLYSLTYTAKVANVLTPATLIVEWRSATSEADVLSADWAVVQPNQLISPQYADGDDVTENQVYQYHQLRVSVQGVEAASDARIFGLGLKGIKLFGDDANAPCVIS